MPNIIPLLPNIVMVTIVVTLICWFILAKTQFGQHLYAIGGNFEASMRAGIPVARTLIKSLYPGLRLGRHRRCYLGCPLYQRRL